jgi:hypothetical protein
VTHRFARRGTYQVVVGATSALDPTGASAVVTVQVGEAHAGPDRTGGGTDSNASAPDGGAASGAKAGPDGEAGQTAPPTREPSRHAQRPRFPSRDRRAPNRHPSAPNASEPEPTEPVEGVLLSDATARPQAALADALRAARAGQPKPAEEGAGGLPPAAWGGLGVVALLGLGGWRERRGLPRHRGAE